MATQQQIQKMVADYAPKIQSFIDAAGAFELTKAEPVEENMELALQLLDGLPYAVEQALPSIRKLKAYRYERMGLFLRTKIFAFAIEKEDMNLEWFKGKGYGQIHFGAVEYDPKERKERKECPCIFIPPLDSFDEDTQEQILYYHEQSQRYQSFAKFMNPTTPAVSMRYSTKAKYRLDKEVPEEEVIAEININVGWLDRQINEKKDVWGKEYSEWQIKEFKREREELLSIDVENVTFARSNYERGLRYLYLSYQCLDGNEVKEYKEVQVSTRRTVNIITLDPRIDELHRRTDLKTPDFLKEYKRMWGEKLTWYMRERTLEEKRAYLKKKKAQGKRKK